MQRDRLCCPLPVAKRFIVKVIFGDATHLQSDKKDFNTFAYKYKTKPPDISD